METTLVDGKYSFSCKNLHGYSLECGLKLLSVRAINLCCSDGDVLFDFLESLRYTNLVSRYVSYTKDKRLERPV